MSWKCSCNISTIQSLTWQKVLGWRKQTIDSCHQRERQKWRAIGIKKMNLSAQESRRRSWRPLERVFESRFLKGAAGLVCGAVVLSIHDCASSGPECHRIQKTRHHRRVSQKCFFHLKLESVAAQCPDFSNEFLGSGYTDMQTDIHTYMHAYIHTYVHTYVHTYIHTYIHTRIHTYIHKYVHTYIRTYIHTYKQQVAWLELFLLHVFAQGRNRQTSQNGP